ncbi:LLM class flavin-dependent oxidoreductase [Acuticoccus mangrovi]|uniref:LLM class flavin-dependent oxidoreductase n=1 Tax=Acuticoccus mangrovi TaxID=2796142 RepID=A0A934IME1_9HYPH|nr:LLM class flavin-dependent oxidoreductase [Acuticoccus mangrovi]
MRSDPTLSLALSGSGAEAGSGDGHRLITEAGRFAEVAGLRAVWLANDHRIVAAPSPNPAIAAAAIAVLTRRIRLRAGPLRLPQDPAAVVRDWAMVDHLSGGRIDLALTADATTALAEAADTVRRVWRGIPAEASHRAGAPLQRNLTLWLAPQDEAGFVLAGRLGTNVLVDLTETSVERIGAMVGAYHTSLGEHGFDPSGGVVTVTAPTFVSEDAARVERSAVAPLRRWLTARRGEAAAARCRDIVETASLIGDRAHCRAVVTALADAGVTEIAGLVDFGVETDMALDALSAFAALSIAPDRAALGASTPVRRHAERPPLDAAAIIPLAANAPIAADGRTALTEGLMEGRPHRVASIETFAGRIGLFALPMFADDVGARRADAVELAGEACLLAEADGARCVALTGLLPAVSRYGAAVADSARGKGGTTIITTGHAYEVASITLAIEAALAHTGRAIDEEDVAVIGLGSIGTGVVRRLMRRTSHPHAMILAELAAKEPFVEALAFDLRGEFGFAGETKLALSRTRQVDPTINEASLVILTAGAADVVIPEALRAGAIVINDPLPGALDTAAATERWEDAADLLVLDRGGLILPEAPTLTWESTTVDRAAWNRQGCPDAALPATILAALLTGAGPQAPGATLTAVDDNAVSLAAAQLLSLGVSGTPPQNAGSIYPRMALRRFSQRFGPAH